MLVDDPELYREEEEFKYRYMYHSKQGRACSTRRADIQTRREKSGGAAADLARG